MNSFMEKAKTKLIKFMGGRYGSDQLSFVLLVSSVLLSILGMVSKFSIFSLLANVLLMLTLYRTFSKKTNQRSIENYKFLMFVSRIQAKYKKIKRKFKDRKTHKYFKCPNCATELRVPKRKGKIRITCPNCSEKFERKT